MKWLIGLIFGGCFIFGAMYLHGDLDGGELYNIDKAHAMDALVSAPVPDVFKPIGAAGSNIQSETVGDDGYQWRLLKQGTGETVATITATLKANSDTSTRVHFKFEMGNTKIEKVEGVDKNMVTDMIQMLSMSAMKEQVDSVLNHRDYDKKSVENAMVAFVLKHAANGDIMRMGIEAQADARNSEREAESHQPSYSSGSTTTPSPSMSTRFGQAPIDATKPAIDPTPSN